MRVRGGGAVSVLMSAVNLPSRGDLRRNWKLGGPRIQRSPNRESMVHRRWDRRAAAACSDPTTDRTGNDRGLPRTARRSA